LHVTLLFASNSKTLHANSIDENVQVFLILQLQVLLLPQQRNIMGCVRYDQIEWLWWRWEANRL